MSQPRRLAYHELSKDAVEGLRQSKRALDKSPLGKALIELVYLRVSQINGCGYCLEMHSTSLRAHGETQARLDTLAGWRVALHYTPRERAALAWAESVTRIEQTGAPDDVFDALREHFTDAEITDLTVAVALMSALNRLAISMRQ